MPNSAIPAPNSQITLQSRIPNRHCAIILMTLEAKTKKQCPPYRHEPARAKTRKRCPHYSATHSTYSPSISISPSITITTSSPSPPSLIPRISLPASILSCLLTPSTRGALILTSGEGARLPTPFTPITTTPIPTCNVTSLAL